MQENGNVRYQLAEASDVTLQLFDMLGREIKLIIQEAQSAGTYTVEWDSNGIAAGVYIIRLTASSDGHQAFQKSVTISVIK
jgi:flagellar hook assembly protein FlgD